MPVIIGDVSDEGRMFIYSVLNSSNTLECDAFIDAVFKLDASKARAAAAFPAHTPGQVYDQYPSNSSEDCRVRLDAIFSCAQCPCHSESHASSDYLFLCPNRNISTAIGQARGRDAATCVIGRSTRMHLSIDTSSATPLKSWAPGVRRVHFAALLMRAGPNYTFCEGHVCHCLLAPPPHCCHAAQARSCRLCLTQRRAWASSSVPTRLR